MNRFVTVLPLAGALLLIASGCTTTGGPAESTAERAEELAQRLLIVDTHIDVPYRLYRNPGDVGFATDTGDFDHPRALEGGLDAFFTSIYIPAEVDAAGQARPFADELIDGVEALTRAHPRKFAIATCSADVARVHEARSSQSGTQVAMALGMENGGPIEGDLANLDHFRERGIRYITLTHSRANHIADSSYDLQQRWGGLSPFGRTLVEAMNDRGVMVDVSHVSDAAFRQVLEVSRVPVIASHSSLRHFTPGFQRNMSDEMLAALARNGGVIQISFGSVFLTEAAHRFNNAQQQALIRLRATPGIAADDPRLTEFTTRYREQNPYPFATLDDVLDHIDRAVDIAGIDHVGIGSDYDGVGDSLPDGLKDVSAFPNLIAGLLTRGYDEQQIEKILSGNLMRVWRAVEEFGTAQGYPPRCRSPEAA